MSLQDDSSATTQEKQPIKVPSKIGKDGRRYFSDKDKRALVKRAKALFKSQSIGKVALALGLNETLLRKWCKRFGVRTDGKIVPKNLPAGVIFSGTKRVFPDEFKANVVKRVESGESQDQVAKELQINANLVSKWYRAAKRSPRRLQAISSSTAPQPGPMKLPDNVKDAITFLRHAKTEIHAMLARGDIKEMDQAHLLAQLALNALLKNT